jgi:hypothetical protein
MKKKRTHVVCINNEGYQASLEVGKIYSVVQDADKHGMIRIVDNSGEDYLFDVARFFSVEIPSALARVLSQNV